MKIQSEPHGDMGRLSEMAARLAKNQVSKVTDLSEIPCRVSSDPHEWRNEWGTVSTEDPVKLK